LETVLAVAIVAAAALLTSLRGAREVARQAPPSPATEETPPIMFVANAGDVYVRMGLEAGEVGSNRVHVSLFGADSQPMRRATPHLRIEGPADAEISPWTVTPWWKTPLRRRRLPQ
jgi:hypothetical protein